MADKILKGEDVVYSIPNLPCNNYLHVADLATFVKLLLEGEMKEECEKALLGVRKRFAMMHILQIMKDVIGSPSKLIAEEKGGMPECSLVNINKALAMGYDPMGRKGFCADSWAKCGEESSITSGYLCKVLAKP